jgi:dihydroneopterin aldolase
MFERFTEKARKVVVLAQEEARNLGHAYIGTEHILLGLLRDENGVAAQALGRLNVTLNGVREQVEAIVGHGEDRDFAQAPFTPRSKKVLELGLRESMQLGHNYIGTEHILLGLVREGEGVAARVLSNLGVEADEVRREVVRMLGDETSLEPEEPPVVEVGPREDERNPLLFRGLVKSLEVGTSVEGRSQPLIVDLDYAYAMENTGDPSEAVDHEDLVSHVRRILDEQEVRTVEDGITKVGSLLLSRFPMIRELTISATREHTLEGGATSGITVTRTFRR